MDDNLTFLVLGLTLCAVPIAQVVWLRVERMHEALVGPLLGLTIGGVAYSAWPESSGYLTFAAAGLFVLLPARLGVLAQRALSLERFDRALLLSRLVALLNPSPIRRAIVRHVRSLEQIVAGERSPEQIAQETTNALGRLRYGFALRVAGRWEELSAFQRAVCEERLPLEPSLGMLAVLALGWQQRHDEMVELARRIEATSDAGALRPSIRLLVAAFLGRVELTVRIALTSAHALPLSVRASWIALARVRAGISEPAEALRALGKSELALVRQAAERELRLPQAIVTESDLSPPMRAYLADIESDLDSADGLTGPARSERVTVWLLIVIIGAQLVAWSRGGGVETLLELGALAVPRFAGFDEWWRVVSAAFLHAGWTHFGLNAVALWSLGRRLESIAGPVCMFSVFAGSAVLGNLGYVLMVSEPTLVVGASGGVCGVAGALGALLLERYRKLGATTYLRTTLGLIAIVFAAQLALEMVLPNIATAGHVIGLISGALILVWFRFVARFLPAE